MEINFWNGKNVLVTGHTGFKGSWLTMFLNNLGANVIGVSLEPEEEPSLYNQANVSNLCKHNICDIRDFHKLHEITSREKIDIVFHLAAQSLVRRSYELPLQTFDVNVVGTANILELIAQNESVKVGIFATTDKVYQNLEFGIPFKEDDRLGGHDPYSSSKAASELVIDSYCKSFFAIRDIAISSVRAGNVIGGGDWSQDRILPDAVRAWDDGETLKIRSPNSIRPWQHVLDCLYGYMLLAEKLWDDQSLQGAYNFGPSIADALSVIDIVKLASHTYDTHDFSIEDDGALHEAGFLSLDVSKATKNLDYKPCWAADEAVKKAMMWYKNFSNGDDAFSLCNQDIHAYLASI